MHVVLAVAAMFAELDRSHPEIEVSPDAFRAEMIGPQKEQSPDGGADLGALRHRTLAFFARKAGHARPEAVADEIMKVFTRKRLLPAKIAPSLARGSCPQT